VALRYFARGSIVLDPGTLGSTFLGIFLTGCLYMAAGLFRLGPDARARSWPP